MPSARGGEDPRRPAAIEAEGVPVVPAGVYGRLAQYDNIRGAAFTGWAPDGRGMLIRTRFGNASQLHRVFEPGGRREQITFFDEPAGGRFIREHAGKLLVTMSDGGNENHQVYLLDEERFATTLITDGKSRNSLGPLSRDGKQLVLASNRRNGRDTDLYLVDWQKPDEPQMLLEVDGEFWYASDFSPDGAKLLLVRFVSVNESYPAVMDVASRKAAPLPRAAAQAADSPQVTVSYRSPQFSPCGKFVYLTTDARGEFNELARLDLAGGEYTWLSGDIPWDVSDVEIDPQTGNVVFAVNADGASELYLIGAAAEEPSRRKLELPLGIVAGMEFSPDGKHLGMTLARPDAPADAWSLEIASGELTRWTYSEVGGLDPSRFVRPERIAFKSFDGREIPAWYYRPAGATRERPAAVLIDIHGGPEGQYRPFFSGTTQFYVNELGLAVIAPNVRGSSGYGKTYLTLDNGMLREDSVKDIGALLDWIAAQEELDAGRVAVSGASYGGYMVLASLVHYGERIKAGIDVVGIANFITFLERTAPYRQDLRRVEYGDERDPDMRAFFERINPTSNAEKIRSALLVAHGRNDPRVPFFEAEQIAERVRSGGRTVWTIYAANEGHGFAKRDNRDYLRAAMVLFLQQQLSLDEGE